MHMDGGRGGMIGIAFPIVIDWVFFPSRRVVPGMHTISDSHLSLVAMEICSLFLTEPLKSLCVCVCVRLSGRG